MASRSSFDSVRSPTSTTENKGGMDGRMEHLEQRMDRAMIILEKMSDQVTELVFLARKTAKQQKSGRLTNTRLGRSSNLSNSILKEPEIQRTESDTFEISVNYDTRAITIQKLIRGHLGRKHAAGHVHRRSLSDDNFLSNTSNDVRLDIIGGNKKDDKDNQAELELKTHSKLPITSSAKSMERNNSKTPPPTEAETQVNARKRLDFFKTNKSQTKVAPSNQPGPKLSDDKLWYNAVVAAIPPNPMKHRNAPNEVDLNVLPKIKPVRRKPRRRKQQSMFRRFGVYLGIFQPPTGPINRPGATDHHVKSVEELKAVVAKEDVNDTVIQNKTKKRDATGQRVVSKHDSYMINPKGRFRLSWDFILVTPMLVYLAVMMPFRLCFANEPKTFSAVYWFEFMIDIIFLIDIVLNFRTGFFINAIESDMIEYDTYEVAKNYIFSWFFLDLASGIPFSLIELIFVSDPNTSGVKTLKTVRLIRFIKLGRLFKIEKILTNMDRDTMDRIEDFFQDNNTRSALVIFGLALKTALVCHLLSCLWVFIGREGSKNGVDNWLEYELKGPFDYHDTVGSGPSVGSIYLAAFYFCLTTMASVGYGDIICRNNTERIFAILLEFTGSLVFAMIVAALTSVVTTMDMNARKTAEQLDAVASFVVNRNFPENLGRRIRRHFRHFYSLKSAIDESKIFGELSTSLRKEVSAYLVSELMGDVSLFTTMSPLLWPHLLPVLRPMRFEADEIVCRQAEECGEMYVVLSGTLTGMTEVAGEEDIRVRRAGSGDTFNVLCVLGVWSCCVETVIADVAVETYAITEKDFGNLFTAETDLDSLEEMKDREVGNFKMETVVEDGAVFLKPLYSCVFSRLDLTIISAKGLAVADYNENSDPYAYVELIDMQEGRPLSKMFTFKTATISKSLNPTWLEALQWMDIITPFDRLALRISIYDSDFVGLDTFLGMIQVPFIDLLKQCNQSKKNAARNALSSSFSPYSPQPNEKVTINNDESKQEQDGTDNIQKFSSTHRNQSRISSSFSSRSLGSPSAQNYKDRLLSRNASFRVKKNKSALEDDLPEMRPGDVEKTYKLQPAIISSIPTQDMVAGGIKEEDEDEEDVGRSSSTLAQPFKLLANKIGLSRTLRMAPVGDGDDDDVDYDEEMSRDVLEVAEVTGEIKIRFYVEKAEKEMTRAPRYHHHTPTSFTHIE